MTFILWLLVCWSISSTVVESVIFRPVRRLLSNVPIVSELVTCMFCTGFWAGLFVSYFWYKPIPEILVLNGFLSAQLVYLLTQIESKIWRE